MRTDSTYFAMVAMILLATALPLSAELGLAPLFGDHMVLQRDAAIPVWGTASPGQAVTVRLGKQVLTTAADEAGNWRISLKPMAATGQALTLTVSSGEVLVKRQDILIGDVWICAGQSNMGMTLTEAFNAEEEIAAANYPLLRHVGVGSGASRQPRLELGRAASWTVCTPKTAGQFFGVAYFFGRHLVSELGVPVGLVATSRGATGVEGWVPLDAYRTTPSLLHIYREVDSWDPTSETGRAAHLETFAELKAWLPKAKDALAKELPVPPMPRLPAPSPHRSDPTEIYNGAVHPLTRLPIRGVIWYQGESNPGEGAIYQQKLQAMIRGWRAAWKQGDFPFYIVQLANEGLPARKPAAEDHLRYVPVREAQRRSLSEPRTGLVVAIDLGEDMNGHPRNKQDVGKRLANLALDDTYGRERPSSGPLFRSHTVAGDTVTVHFDHADSGLMIADKEGLEAVRELKTTTLKHVALAGADGVWYWAEGLIDGSRLTVRSPQVPAPRHVRYAYSMNPKGPKLYNRDGLPASPFSSEPWDAPRDTAP